MATSADRVRDHLLERLLLDRELLAGQMMDRIRAELAVYEPRATTDVAPGIVGNTEQLVAAVRERRSLSDRELSQFAELGRLRATQGIPVEDLLYAWRLGVEVVVEEITRRGRASDVPAEALLDLAAGFQRVADRGMLAVARGHREEEIARTGNERDRRAEFVRQVLQGTLSPSTIRVQAEVFGLDAERSYHAIRARPTAELAAVELERQLGLARGAGRPSGLGALVDGDVAGFIDRPRKREISAPVGIGPAVALEDLNDSFRRASRALATAIAFGLEGMRAFEELGARPAMAADREVGDELKRRYITEPLAAAGDTGRTFIETVERYLAGGMRVDATADEMHVHPNTLRHRLRRFEELTGADLRDPDCVVEVWWALQRARLDDAAHQ